jgi:lipopolysaccharide biosynthesis glycosyltransferase
MAGKPAVFRDAPLDVSRVRHWRSFYGSHVPYGRIFLPRLLPERDEVIYLDADVIVDLDVRKLVTKRREGDLLAALPNWDFAHSHDARLAADIGVPGETSYFQSGVLVFDLAEWRKDDTLTRCLDIGDRYHDRLRSHDQTILNLGCRGRISDIPREWTTYLYPTRSGHTGYPEQSIRNFCGAPKPFDPLGNVLNYHFDLFNQWLSRTALAGWSPNNFRQLSQLKRNVRLIKPVVSTVSRMLLKKIRP